MKSLDTLRWVGGIDGHLVLIDQTRLPVELLEIECRDVETVWEAVKMLRVRGAPAIGIAAAYGLCVAMQTVAGTDNSAIFFARLDEAAQYLAGSRPTAVNLFWALERMKAVAEPYRNDNSPCQKSLQKTLEQAAERLLHEARAIHEEDRKICRQMGRHGAELLSDGQGVLTHCNAGSLATADYGTALAVIYAAVESGKKIHAYADETRPLLQGARLTAWELKQRDIPVTLICDSMAAQVMREGRVQAVITGADRIAANGDVANKIGTYSLALVAAAHDVPFYVAAPTSTFDLSIPDGDAIPIEQRDPREITHGFGRQTAPEGIDVYNPAFDVTPARLIHTIICEKGLIRPVNAQRIAEVVK